MFRKCAVSPTRNFRNRLNSKYYGKNTSPFAATNGAGATTSPPQYGSKDRSIGDGENASAIMENATYPQEDPAAYQLPQVDASGYQQQYVQYDSNAVYDPNVYDANGYGGYYDPAAFSQGAYTDTNYAYAYDGQQFTNGKAYASEVAHDE